MTTFIIVKLALEGIHKYPAAPEAVGFLRYPHRHMFHMEFHIEVFDEDRELEFITVKHEIGQIAVNYFMSDVNNSTTSCEMIATQMRRRIQNKYPIPSKLELVSDEAKQAQRKRRVNVKIMEDDEGGVILMDEGDTDG